MTLDNMVGRFHIAFEALLQIALVALRANGYRTTSDSGHQQLAIQLLPKSIGIDPSELRAPDEYRRRTGSSITIRGSSVTPQRHRCSLRSPGGAAREQALHAVLRQANYGLLPAQDRAECCSPPCSSLSPCAPGRGCVRPFTRAVVESAPP